MKAVFIVNADLKMGKGKIAAQVAHAAVELALKLFHKNRNLLERWLGEGQKKIVVKASEKEILQLLMDLPGECDYVVIRDAGLTQIPPGSLTVVGLAPFDEIDKYTGKFKLL